MRRLILFALLTAASLCAQQPVAVQGAGAIGTSDAAWTSGTSVNTAVTLVTNSSVFNSIEITLIQGTTITGGVVTFESSIDNSNWISVRGVEVDTTTIMGPTYTLAASLNIGFVFPVNAPYLRVRLSTAITGSGTITIQHASETFPDVGLLAGAEILAAGTNVIGHVIADSGSTEAVTQSTFANLKATVELSDGTNTPAVKAASTASAATDPALVVANSPNGGNPCQNPSATLAMVAGQTSGTSSTQLIALSGSTHIYMCGITIQGISGTTPTFALRYGTGTACATGTNTIIGAFATTASATFVWGAQFLTPAGQELCYIQTGTTPISNYAISYVQQ